MVLAVIGVSFQDTPLADIERLSDSPSLRESLRDLSAAASDRPNGSVVVSTCNRLEAYVDVSRFHDAMDAIVTAAADAWQVAPTEASNALHVRTGESAARHLFRVTSGMESMVVGEAEISGQVADALRQAQDAGTTTSALNLLFQSAARCAKAVTSRTDLGAAGRSVAATALDQVERRVGPLADAAVLLIGTGSYARVVAADLTGRGCTRVTVYSASGRHRVFAADRGLAAVDLADLPATLSDVDLVVTCSGTGAVVLTEDVVTEGVARRHRPLTIVDLALRGDVPDATRALPGVDVIALDALNAAEPAAATITAAERIIAEAVDAFDEEVAVRRLDPAIVALRGHVTALVDAEMAELRHRIPPDVVDEVERSVHRIAGALLHTPTIRARVLARDGHGADYVRALHTLFGIDTGEPTPRASTSSAAAQEAAVQEADVAGR